MWESLNCQGELGADSFMALVGPAHPSCSPNWPMWVSGWRPRPRPSLFSAVMVRGVLVCPELWPVISLIRVGLRLPWAEPRTSPSHRPGLSSLGLCGVPSAGYGWIVGSWVPPQRAFPTQVIILPVRACRTIWEPASALRWPWGQRNFSFLKYQLNSQKESQPGQMVPLAKALATKPSAIPESRTVERTGCFDWLLTSLHVPWGRHTNQSKINGESS